jgi:hypothetical protein
MRTGRAIGGDRAGNWRVRCLLAVAALALVVACNRSPAPEPDPEPPPNPALEQREELARELADFIEPYVGPVKEVLGRYARLPLSNEPLSPHTGWEAVADRPPDRGYVAFETSRVSDRVGHVSGRLRLYFTRRGDEWHLVTNGGYLHDFRDDAHDTARIYDFPPELHVDIRAIFEDRSIESDLLSAEARH